MAYIDKEKLIKDIENKRLVIHYGTSAAEAIRIQGKAIRRAIEEAPTADVVGVVRCKDCKHANDDGTICRYSEGRAVEPEHFCGYGEREENK